MPKSQNVELKSSILGLLLHYLCVIFEMFLWKFYIYKKKDIFIHIIVDIEKTGTLEILRKTSGGRPSRHAVGPSRQAVGLSIRFSLGEKVIFKIGNKLVI